MPRTPARFTQSDIARCIRAVQQCNAPMRVRLAPDGSIIIERDVASDPVPIFNVEAGREFRL